MTLTREQFIAEVEELIAADSMVLLTLHTQHLHAHDAALRQQLEAAQQAIENAGIDFAQQFQERERQYRTELAAVREERDQAYQLLYGARCIHCGVVVAPDCHNQDIGDLQLQAHIEVCAKHPMAKLKQQLADLQGKCDHKSETIALDTIRFVENTKRAVEIAGGGTSLENALERIQRQLAEAQAQVKELEAELKPFRDKNERGYI